MIYFLLKNPNDQKLQFVENFLFGSKSVAFVVLLSTYQMSIGNLFLRTYNHTLLRNLDKPLLIFHFENLQTLYSFIKTLSVRFLNVR